MVSGNYTNLVRTVKVLFRVKEFTDVMSPKEVLDLIHDRNPGVDTSVWRVVSCKEEVSHQIIVLNEPGEMAYPIGGFESMF